MKLLFSLLFSLATVTGFFLDRGLPFESMSFPSFAAYLVATAALTAIIWFVTVFLLQRMPATGRRMMPVKTYADRILITGTASVQDAGAGSQKRNGIGQWLAITGLLILCWLPVWLAYWPGFWNYDVPFAGSVITGSYSSMNPLLNTLLMGLCYAAGKMFANENAGVVLYTLIQMFLMAGIFSYVIRYTCRFIRPLLGKILLFLFYAFFPVNPLMALSPTKDVLFAGGITLLTVLMLQLYFDRESADTQRAAVLRTGLLVLVLLMRHNGLFGLLLLIVSVLLLGKKISFPASGKRMLLLSLALWLLFSAALTAGLHASSGTDAEMYSVSIQQFGRIHAYGDEEERAVAEQFFDYGEAYYTPSISDSMKKALQPGNRGAFFLQSAKWALQHPLISLDAFLYLTKGHWDIDDRTHAEAYYAMNPELKQGYLATDIYGGFGIERNSILPELENWYTRMFVQNEVFEIPLLRNFFPPAFWHWLFLFCALAWYRYAPKRVSVYLLFLCGILLSILLGPVALIRYSYPFVTCAPVLLVFAFVFAGRHAGGPGEERTDSGEDGA